MIKDENEQGHRGKGRRTKRDGTTTKGAITIITTASAGTTTTTLPAANFKEKQRRLRTTPSTIQGHMMLPSSINPSKTLPTTFNFSMATTSRRPCETWLQSPSSSPANPPDSLIQTIHPEHCVLMRWTCISGNAPSRRPMTARTSMKKIWQKPLLSFIISAIRLSRMTSKLLPPLLQSAVIKMSSDFSS